MLPAGQHATLLCHPPKGWLAPSMARRALNRKALRAVQATREATFTFAFALRATYASARLLGSAPSFHSYLWRDPRVERREHE